MKTLVLLGMLLGYFTVLPQQQIQPFHNTQGQLEINNSGQATYTLPIAVPPSIKNTAPIIAVGYQSGQSGGIAGQGWNIQGLSAISRIPSRLDIDGYRQGILFTNDDKLALNGQRLLVVSGQYWQIGSTYQTETQSNLKIELQRNGNGIYFIVTDPDGSRSWYGNYTDNHATDLAAFYICRYEDPLGNYITYHYNKPFNKSLCLYEIRFSAHTDDLAPLNSIQLYYKPAQRTESAYNKGMRQEKAALLETIQVWSGGQLFREYNFTYVSDPQLGYEKISQIQEFNGAMQPANPIRFEYENTQTLSSGSELLTTYHNKLAFNAIVLKGDFDGDGRLDFATENQIYAKNFLGTNGQMPVNAPITIDSLDTFTATTLTNNKLNAFQSIVKYSGSEGFKIYNLQNRNLTLSYTKNFSFPFHLSCFNLLSPCNSVRNAFIEGDFNGDGISEVIMYKICTSGQGSRFIQYECENFYWIDLNPNLSGQISGNMLSSQAAPGATILSKPDLLRGTKRYVGDFNGDGKSDILAINNNGDYKIVGFKQLTSAPWMEPELLGKGTLSNYTTSKKILFGDFNGDGKTDILLPDANGTYPGNSLWHIYFSNPKPAGGSFFEVETYNIVDYWHNSGTHFKDGIQSSSYHVLDTNGDGKSDLVRIWRNQYIPKWNFRDLDTNWKITSYINNIGYQNKNGFTEDYVTPCQNYDNSCDHHSDSPDMVIPVVSSYRRGINKEILMVRNHYKQVTYIQFTKDVAKDNLLKKVTAANGAIVDEINYQTLEPEVDNSGYGFYSSSNSLTYPLAEIKKLPFTRVVSRLTNKASGFTRHQDFKYHGYAVNWNGLGALGFIKTARSSWYQLPSDKKIWNVIQNDPTKRGLMINTYSELKNPGASFLFSSETRIPDNAISSIVNEYSIVINNKVYTPLLIRQTSTDFLTAVKSVKNYQYHPVFYLPDIVNTQTFSGTILQGQTTVETEYAHNPSGTGNNYYIGRPVKTLNTTTAYNDQHRTETRYTYNANGMLLKTQQKPSEESYFLTEETEYDRYGNIVKKTVSTPGSAIPTTPRVSEYTYDSTARFVTANKNVSLGQVTQYTYHPLYGTVITETDPNHFTTTTAYDHWGKPVTITDPLGKHISYLYIKTNDQYITKTDNDDGSSSVSVFNALGLPVKNGKKLLDGLWHYTATEYDYLGRTVKVSEPFQDTPSLWTSYSYDDYSRLQETVLPTGKTSRISYNGLTVTSNDGHQTNSVTKNANGHTVSSTDNGGTITYHYYATGALKASHFREVTLTTEYDSWGRKSKLIDPSAGEYRYSYYPFGEIQTTTTPKGIIKNFIDAYGRTTMTEEESVDGTSYYTRYYYNTDTTFYGSVREEYLSGKVTNEEYHEYDDYKRPKRITQSTPHADFVKELTYDAFGRIEKEKQTATVKANGKTSSKTFRYAYQFGYRHQILDDATGRTLWSARSVNARDQLTQGAFGNGLLIGNHYGDYGHIQRSDTYHPNRHTSTPRPILTLNTKFNIQTGNLTERNNSLVNHSATFEYDAGDRLVKWDKEIVKLYDIPFDQGVGEFVPTNCAALTNENGKLKVTAIPSSCPGIKKVILTQGVVGEKIKFRVQVTKTSSHPIRVYIVEHDPVNNLYDRYFMAMADNSELVFEHTVSDYPVVELHLDVLPLSETNPVIFYIDNLVAERCRTETQQYDDHGRITDNNLGYYAYNNTHKPYQNTSIELLPEANAHYENREGIFNDDMEEQKGWEHLLKRGGVPSGNPIYDDSKSKSGKYALKIHSPDYELTSHSLHWIPIDNTTTTPYTFSGWVYSDGPSSQLFLFMNSENETGYYTIVADIYTEVTNQWVYLERTVYVPAYIKKLRIRVDNNGGGNVWFDDIRIRKTANPKTAIRQLNITYDMFKKPVTITETGVEKVAFSYTADHFRNAMYYGSLEAIDQRPFRKDYASDGSVEITTNQLTNKSTFVFFVGGDAYTAPAIFKDNGQTGSYYYLHRDHQGSIVAISDQEGHFVEKRQFDPWGNLIKVQDKQGHNLTGLTLLDRGYTGHEHLQGIGIINMNGRLYDPKLHRFLSPDNYIQDPYNTQNYNRYGYCFNNPLKYSDPDGELVWYVPVIYAAVNVGVDLLMNDGKMNFGQIAISAGLGALSGALSGGTSVGAAFLGAGISQMNRFLPSIPIYQSTDFNLNISPMIGFGSSGFTFGGSLNAGGLIGDFAYNISAGAGFNSGASSLGEPIGGSRYWNLGGFAGYHDAHANYGLGYSYNSFSGKTGQGVAAITIQAGDFGMRIDEDYLGDNGDRYRTGGLLATYKINNDLTLVFGGSMMTGDARGVRVDGGNPKYSNGLGMYDPKDELLPNLRGGTMYGGTIYKGQANFYGHNSEKRLHRIQNWIHRNVVTTPYFPDRGLRSMGYTFSGSYLSSYLYY